MLRVGVAKELGEFRLEVSLVAKRGEFVMLTGPSGSGKTTLLRILAGLERCEGEIEVDGEIWQGRGRFVPPQRRSVSFVFQEYALFPNMSVLDNLLYVKRDPALALHLLKMVDLLDLQRRVPSTLSGGQKQRVALARALMKRPKLLLLDEPLSAIDPSTRSYLQGKIAELHREFGVVSIMVSHDIAEIYRLGDRVVRMERGKIVEEVPKERLASGRRVHKAEVVDVQGEKIAVGFMGGIYWIEAKGFEVGDVIEVEIEGLRPWSIE